MAAGDSRRLGLSTAKGLYQLDLPSKPTFFKVFIERIKHLCELAKEKYPNEAKENNLITLYIIISDIHNSDIYSYMEENNYFGYNKIRFYESGTEINIFDEDHNINLKSKNEILKSSFGNGMFIKLIKKKIYSDILEDKVEFIHIQSVDNLLVKPGDPFLLGFLLKEKKDLVFKTLKKVDPTENVGIHVKTKDGYSVYGLLTRVYNYEG